MVVISKPSVSALVVTYNHEQFIGEAIRSALDQRWPALEVVVVDDGSTDRTVEQVRAIADPRVILLAEPHRGIARLAETYNKGLELCRGEFIATLEGDDRWPSEKLSRQIANMADSAVVCSHGPYAVIGARGSILRAYVPSQPRLRPGKYDALGLHLRMSYIMPVTAVMRRRTLVEIGGFQQLGSTVHWDWPTFLALAERGAFLYRSEVVGHWRKHARSGTMLLTGRDLEGTALSAEIAIATRARLRHRGDLPDDAEIHQEWSNAYARQVWHAARVMLLAHRYEETRKIVAQALTRNCSATLRARLLVAWLAAAARVDLEWLARLLGGRSAVEELV